MKTRKHLTMLLICVILFTTLVGCGGGDNNIDTNEENTDIDNIGDGNINDTNVVVYAQNLFDTLDPYETNGTTENWVFTNIFETLVTVDNEGNNNPQLAKTWDVSDDGLVYTFYLVEDSYFSNGENVKASDVVFTIDYAKQNVKRTTYYGMIDSAKAIDDYTVEITLTKVSPLFLSYLYYIPVLSEKFVTEKNGEINREACGSGPYKISDYDPATHCKLEAVEDYHYGAPAIKNAEIRHVSDASSAQVSFESGEIHVMEVQPSAAESIISSGKYNIEVVSPMHCSLLLINCKKAPFDNQLVRKALSYAVDKQACIDIAYDGYASELRLMADTDSFGVDFSDAENITYDPDKAKTLLAEAGYPDGIDFSEYGITMDTLTSGYYEKLAQVIQSSLSDVGVKIEITGNDNASSDVPSGNYGLCVYGYAYKNDFSYSQAHYTTGNIGGSNGSHFSDAYVDEAFEKGDSETNPEKRKEIYKDLVTHLVDQCPNIPVFNKQLVMATDKNLNCNFLTDVNHQHVFYDWSWVN